jgi:hypothetical protein
MLALLIAAAVQATYSVPVTPALADVATFSLDATIAAADGTVTLRYELPDELAGSEPLPLVLSGPTSPGRLELDGERASAVCNPHGEGLLCLISYKKAVAADLAARQPSVAAAVDALVADPLEGVRRKRVAALFATEPAGVLSLPIRP